MIKRQAVPKKGETTRISIEDAAMELFMEQGYHATSMRQIADQAGLALGGIYNHFSSKEDIFQAIIIDKHPYRRILPLVLQAQGDTVEEFMRNVFKIVVSELHAEPVFIRILLIELVEFGGKHSAGMLKEIAPQVLPVFERLIKGRKDLRVTNPVMFLRSFFGMLLSYFLTDMIIRKSHLNILMPKNPLDTYFDIYLHGILKEPA